MPVSNSTVTVLLSLYYGLSLVTGGEYVIASIGFFIYLTIVAFFVSGSSRGLGELFSTIVRTIMLEHIQCAKP